MSLESERTLIAREILATFNRPHNQVEYDKIDPLLDRLVRAARAVSAPDIEPLTQDQVDLCIATAGQTGEWYIYHSGIESNVPDREIEHEIDHDPRSRDGYAALGELLAAAVQLNIAATSRL